MKADDKIMSENFKKTFSSNYTMLKIQRLEGKKCLQIQLLVRFKCYALVICNHGPPTPGAGRGIAVEMSGVFTFALSPQCGGNTRDLCYIGKNGGAMKT